VCRLISFAANCDELPLLVASCYHCFARFSGCAWRLLLEALRRTMPFSAELPQALAIRWSLSIPSFHFEGPNGGQKRGE